MKKQLGRSIPEASTLMVRWPELWIGWNLSIPTIDTAISLRDRRG